MVSKCALPGILARFRSDLRPLSVPYHIEGCTLPPAVAHRRVYPAADNFSIRRGRQAGAKCSLKVLKVLKENRMPPALIFQGFQKPAAHRQVYFCSSSSLPILQV